ncbi:hypothetical protein Tco_1500573 [Tanacetum coccineum]
MVQSHVLVNTYSVTYLGAGDAWSHCLERNLDEFYLLLRWRCLCHGLHMYCGYGDWEEGICSIISTIIMGMMLIVVKKWLIIAKRIEMLEVVDNCEVQALLYLVLGHPQDEANASVLYISGIQRTSAPSDSEIEGNLLTLRPLLKEHNGRGNVSPIRLSFDDTEDQPRVQIAVTGIVGDADLKRPFKEVVKTPLTRRIIEFASLEFKMPANIKLYDGTTDLEDHLSRFSSAANSGEWPMLVWCRMFQQTLDRSARGWFENLPNRSIDGWAELKLQFITRFSTRRACFKDPTEITKIARRTIRPL